MEDFALYDSTRPYTLHFDRPFRQVVLQIPYDSLTEQFIKPEIITARRISAQTAVGALASQFIRSVAGRLDVLMPEGKKKPVTPNRRHGLKCSDCYRKESLWL